MNDTKQNNSEWRDRELGALWVRQGKSQKYLSGHLEVETMPGVSEKIKVVVFSNKGKSKNEQAPDYVVYRSVDKEEAVSAEKQTSQDSQDSQDSEEIPAALV